MQIVASKSSVLKFLPAIVFIVVMVIHFISTGYSPYEEAQSQWIEIESNVSLWKKYLNAQDYYLGFSYAISFAFSALAFCTYQERSSCNSSKFAFGGLGFSGGLAVAGCFLVGCCGSPMLVVYSSVLGMKYANMAKPFIAGVTTLIIVLCWIWMKKKFLPPEILSEGCKTKNDKSNGGCC